MKRLFIRTVVPATALMFFQLPSVAQNGFTSSAGVDIVSNYVWRGQDLGNVSIQPALSISYAGFTLSAWGSAGFTPDDTREVDLTLGYSVAGFSISVTDYWFDGGPGYFHYGDGRTNHTFEAQAGYDFGFLAVNWYTNFAGNTGFKADGTKAYASYISVSAPFRFAGLDWNAVVGATPWQNDFYTGGGDPLYSKASTGGFAVCEVGLKAARSIQITDNWEIPVFVQLVWNPSTENVHFIAGISI